MLSSVLRSKQAVAVNIEIMRAFVRLREMLASGKEREEDILADTMAVPLQPVRTFGKNLNGDEWQNMLIFGDNLQVMKSLLDLKKAGKLSNADGMPGVRVVYIDPPSIEYAWKKGNTPKRGEFNPDFFIKKGDMIFVVETKGDEEISEPSPENQKKYEYAHDHFQRLNKWLENEGLATRYQFNFVSPKDYNQFFQRLRDNTLNDFRSELDVVMRKTNGQ